MHVYVIMAKQKTEYCRQSRRLNEIVDRIIVFDLLVCFFCCWFYFFYFFQFQCKICLLSKGEVRMSVENKRAIQANLILMDFSIKSITSWVICKRSGVLQSKMHRLVIYLFDFSTFSPSIKHSIAFNCIQNMFQSFLLLLCCC